MDAGRDSCGHVSCGFRLNIVICGHEPPLEDIEPSMMLQTGPQLSIWCLACDSPVVMRACPCHLL